MFDDVRELYQELILDHGRRPRNFGVLDDANRSAAGDNPMCGDRITVFLNVDDDGIIRQATFDGRGCAISTASASMMTEIVKGKSVDEAYQLFESFQAMCTKDGHDMAAHQARASKEHVIEALRQVYDPEIPVNIFELGLIHEFDVGADGTAAIEMTLTTPACPVAGVLPHQVADSVATVPGTGEVSVTLVWDPLWPMDQMSDEARLSLDMF